MLINLNEMKKAEVITVRDGLVQAVNGPIAYIGYLDNFVGHSFSVDGEILATALKDLEPDFMVHSSKEKVIVFDSVREITFVPKVPEQLIKLPSSDQWILRDIAHPWQVTDKFVNQQFPGILVTKDYFETISDASIVRVKHHLSFDDIEAQFILARCKLPAKSVAYAFYDNKLWLQYKDSNFVIIKRLEIQFPPTDSYFAQKLKYQPIPDLKAKLVPCEKVKFEDNNLILIKEDAAQAVIENIPGRGVYDFKLFSKIINTASSWQMTDTALFFSGINFTGLIENVEHHTV